MQIPCFGNLFALVFLAAPSIVLAQPATSKDVPAVMCSQGVEGEPPPVTWVFLGDSNTYAGRFVALFDAVCHNLSGNQLRGLNLAVASETASGLSEPDHPFPRPCVHSRIDKTLRMLKPSIVVVCYGMNDGIYQPLSDEVLETYKSQMRLLAKKIKEAGARLILMTPPPFEAEAIRATGKKFGPNANGNYAWNAPAEDYDEVLAAMSAWCLENEVEASNVIDLRSALLKFKSESPEGTLLTGDGVHFGEAAHDVVNETIWATLIGEDFLSKVDLQPQEIESALGRMKLLRDAYLSAVGKNRPGLPAGLPLAVALEKANEE